MRRGNVESWKTFQSSEKNQKNAKSLKFLLEGFLDEIPFNFFRNLVSFFFMGFTSCGYPEKSVCEIFCWGSIIYLAFWFSRVILSRLSSVENLFETYGRIQTQQCNHLVLTKTLVNRAFFRNFIWIIWLIWKLPVLEHHFFVILQKYQECHHKVFSFVCLPVENIVYQFISGKIFNDNHLRQNSYECKANICS